MRTQTHTHTQHTQTLLLVTEIDENWILIFFCWWSMCGGVYWCMNWNNIDKPTEYTYIARAQILCINFRRHIAIVPFLRFSFLYWWQQIMLNAYRCLRKFHFIFTTNKLRERETLQHLLTFYFSFVLFNILLVWHVALFSTFSFLFA